MEQCSSFIIACVGLIKRLCSQYFRVKVANYGRFVEAVTLI